MIRFLRLQIENSLIVSKAAYLIVAPTSILSLAVIEAVRFPEVSFLLLISIAAISYFQFLITLLIFHFAVLKFKSNSTTSLASIMLTGALLGMIKGQGVTFLLIIFQLETPDQPLNYSRIISGALVTALAMPILAFLNSEISRLRETRISALDSLVKSRVDQFQETGVSEFLSSQMQNHFDATFSNQLQNIIKELESPNQSDMTKMLEKLSTITRGQLNEIKQEIQASYRKEYPEINFLNLFRYALQKQPFPIFLIVAILLISSINYVLTSTPSDQLFTRLLVIALVPSIIFWLGNVIITQLKKGQWIVWLLFISISAPLTFISNAAIFDDEILPLLGPILIYEIWTFSVCVFSSLLVAFSQQRTNIDSVLLAELDENLIKQRAIELVNSNKLREISSFIHGQVQSRIMAATVNIALAQESKNETAIDAEIANLREMANSPLKNFDPTTEKDLSSSISQLSNTWKGLLTIEFLNHSQVKLYELESRGVANLLEEALLNAFRHGHAALIQIGTKHSDSHLTITVTDDGMGPRNGAPGIGSSIYDAFTSKWHLSPGPNGIGSQLTLEIDIPQDSN